MCPKPSAYVGDPLLGIGFGRGRWLRWQLKHRCLLTLTQCCQENNAPIRCSLPRTFSSAGSPHPTGDQFYVRQLHDAKIKPLVETFDAEMLDAYAQACGWVLARAHAKASEISATISGYLGSSNDVFDTAMGKFALTYADQVKRDHGALKTAVRKGEVATIKDDLGLS